MSALDPPSRAALDTPRYSSTEIDASPTVREPPTVPPLSLADTDGTNGTPGSAAPAPNGTQLESPKLEEVLEQLKEVKRKGTSIHWQRWSFILAPAEKDEAGLLQHEEGLFLVHSVCGHGYSVKLKSNFSRILNDHICYKIRNKRKFCEVTKPAVQSAVLQGEPDVKRVVSLQKAVQPFSLKEKQQEHLRNLFAKLVYDNYGSVGLRLADMFQPFFEVLGMEPITREWIAGSNLDRMYEAAVKIVRQALKDAEYVQFTFDGLSEATAAGDEKRINCLAMIPGRSALYLGVVHVEEACLDADYLTDLMVKLAKFWVGDEGGNLTRKTCGFLFDSEVVNKAAATALERLYPHLTNVPCQAHCGAKLMKDIQKAIPCVGETLECCRLIAKVVREHSPLRKAFVTAARKYATSTMPPQLYSEMRFDGELLTANECLTAAESLKEIFGVGDHASSHSKLEADSEVQDVSRILAGPDFFQKVLMVQELLQPLSDHIHHMESDRPALPQIRNIWAMLEAHFITWGVKYGEEKVLESVMAQHMEKNFIDAFPTAFLLDPAYCVRITGALMLPPYSLLKPHEKRQVDRHLITRSDGKGSKVAAELVAFTTNGYLDTTFAGVNSKSLNNDVTNPLGQRLQCWDGAMAREYPFLCREARRLIGMHTTCCAPERNWLQPQVMCQDNRARLIETRASKMFFIANCKALDSGAPVATDEMDLQLLYSAALESKDAGEYQSDFMGELMMDPGYSIHDEV